MNNYSSIYIHIPFCHNICSYCDFCKMFYNEELVDKYLDSLEDEISNYEIPDNIKTIYIGGGTPSSLNNNQLERLFSITDNINLSNNYEFTFEINPEDINEELLIILKNHRVNRISIGIETINSKFYKLLNRSNDITSLKNKIDLCKKYFTNINIDLMYAFPNETIEDLEKDLEFFISLDIPHISIYSLIIEENTVLYNNKTKNISEEIDSEMYNFIINYLKERNYIHYEISNFCKEGYQSIHNSTYWNNDKYLGIGLGASGYIDNFRYSNTRSINKYLDGNYILDKEYITKNNSMEYEMILGLRKIEGVNKKSFFDKYHIQLEDKFDIMEMVNNKFLVNKGDYIYIPEDKLYISNSILVNFIGEDDE